MLDFLTTQIEKMRTAASLGYHPSQLRFEYAPTGEIAKIYEASSGREVSRYLKAPFEYRKTRQGATLLTFAPNSNTVTSRTHAFAAE